MLGIPVVQNRVITCACSILKYTLHHHRPFPQSQCQHHAETHLADPVMCIDAAAVFIVLPLPTQLLTAVGAVLRAVELRAVLELGVTAGVVPSLLPRAAGRLWGVV